jgi:opacity protein-like surface antigen
MKRHIMKKITLVAAFALLGSLNSYAQNVGDFYGEVAYTSFSFSAEDVSSDNLGTFKPSSVSIGVGNVVAENLAVEGYIIQGASSDTRTINGSDVDFALAIKTSYGFAIRPFINVTDDLELFGRLGVMRLKVRGTASAAGVFASATGTQTRSMYGLGAAYKLSDKVKLTADYKKLSTKDDVKVSLVSIGLRYAF